MRNESISIYNISELSDSAQKVAHTEYLNNEFECFWLDEYVNSLKKFEEYFRIKIKNYSLGSCDCYVDYDIDWYRFDNRHYEDEISNLSGLRLARYIHNNFYWCIYEKKSYWKGNKKRKSKIQLDSCCPFTGYCGDMDLIDPILKFLAKPDKNINFTNLIDLCIDSFTKAVRNDCESQECLQYFIDHAAANEYEFTEDGKRY